MSVAMTEPETTPQSDAQGRASRHDNLMRLLDEVETKTGGGRVSVRDLLTPLGPRACAPMLLLPCLALVSPASTVPGVPSFLALIVGMVAGQMLFGQDRLWLPAFVLDRSMDDAHLRRTINFLRRPVAALDPWINERLTSLADKPANIPAFLIFCTVSLLMPMIEVVPFLTSVLALAMTLFAIRLFARDGVFMLGGYALSAAGAVLVALPFFLLG